MIDMVRASHVLHYTLLLAIYTYTSTRNTLLQFTEHELSSSSASIIQSANWLALDLIKGSWTLLNIFLRSKEAIVDTSMCKASRWLNSAE